MRKQIGIKLPENLVETIDYICAENEITRTMFIELAIRERLHKHKIKIKNANKKPKYWHGPIEDMPLRM